MTSWLDRTVSARLLFIWACALAPSLLLPTPIPVRAAQMVVLGAGAIGAARRLRWLRTALFFTAVVGFNLATPGGRVLVEVVGFPVTDGALHAGLTKALALTNLLLLSRIAIRRDLELPGAAGALISLTLAYVRYLLDADLKLLARDPVGRLDRLLLAAQREVNPAGAAASHYPPGRAAAPAAVSSTAAAAGAGAAGAAGGAGARAAGAADAPGTVGAADAAGVADAAGAASTAGAASAAGAAAAVDPVGARRHLDARAAPARALPGIVVLVLLLAANWTAVLVAAAVTAG